MKLHILSDLHIEFSNYTINPQNADILVLAGDIGNGLIGLEYATQYKKNYRHIIYVPGNHEFYGHHLSRLSIDMRKAANNLDIKLLDNEYTTIDDTLIIGSTLWTDFRLYGDSINMIGHYMNQGANGLNDFSQIRYGTYWFQPSNCATLSIASQEFIKNTLKKEEFSNLKKVVITHHGPSIKSIHPKYKGNELNPCFSNNLDQIVKESDLWIHGHTHESLDYFIENTHVICNPRGYSNNQDTQENISFDPELVVEI